MPCSTRRGNKKPSPPPSRCGGVRHTDPLRPEGVPVLLIVRRVDVAGEERLVPDPLPVPAEPVPAVRGSAEGTPVEVGDGEAVKHRAGRGRESEAAITEGFIA